MANNKKPRKKHRVKSLPGQLPVTLRYSSTAANKLHLDPRQELEKFRTNRGNADAWGELIFMLNVGLKMATELYNKESEHVLEEALSAMCEISDRFKRVNAWGAKDEEIGAVQDGLSIVEAIMSDSTRRQQRDAANYVFEKVNAK